MGCTVLRCAGVGVGVGVALLLRVPRCCCCMDATSPRLVDEKNARAPVADCPWPVAVDCSACWWSTARAAQYWAAGAPRTLLLCVCLEPLPSRRARRHTAPVPADREPGTAPVSHTTAGASSAGPVSSGRGREKKWRWKGKERTSARALSCLSAGALALLLACTWLTERHLSRVRPSLSSKVRPLPPPRTSSDQRPLSLPNQARASSRDPATSSPARRTAPPSPHAGRSSLHRQRWISALQGR